MNKFFYKKKNKILNKYNFIDNLLIKYSNKKVLNITCIFADIYNISVIIFTNKYIIEKYGKRIIKSLKLNKCKIKIFLLKEGEDAKKIDICYILYNKLYNSKITKNDIILIFGGGTISDIALYVAKTYLRGVKCINIPTTYLSMIDASFGGKSGVNLKLGKNMIGSIVKADYIILNLFYLKTLSKVNILDGLTESLKHNLIGSIYNLYLVYRGLIDNIKNMVIKSIKIKLSIIYRDRFDRGIRNILNFGHTFGHAIESSSYYKIRHGEAVVLGLIVSLNISSIYNNKIFDLSNIFNLCILTLKLPIRLNECSFRKIWRYLYNDKKIDLNQVNMILLNDKSSLIRSINDINVCLDSLKKIY